MRLLLLIALSCLGVSLHAQDTPLPRPATQDPAPLEPTPTPGITAPPAAPELIPADILPAPDPAAPSSIPQIPTIEQLDAGLKPAPLSPAAEKQRLHIEWRRLRNRVQNQPVVKAAYAKAEGARTDLEKRKLLARYYELFYREMTAIAPPEMAGYLADRKREHLLSLPQPRVRPETLSLNPAPPKAAGSPVPGVSPSPAPVHVGAATSPSPSPRGLGLPRP